MKDAFAWNGLTPEQFVTLCRTQVNLLKWQEKHADAEKYLRSRINDQNKKKLLVLLAELYAFFRDRDKAHEAYLEAGMARKALSVYESADHKKARAFALKILADKKNYDETFRGSILAFFLEPGAGNAAIRKKYAPLMKYVNTQKPSG